MTRARLVVALILLGLLLQGAVTANFAIIRNQRLSRDVCAMTLLLSRNLFTPLPVDNQTSPELRDYIDRVLTPLYKGQYRQLDREFHLEERCVARLPDDAPPPPP